MTDSTKLILVLFLLVALIIFGPLVTIWSLNTIFPVLSVPYNLATWFATAWLFSFFAYRGSK